MLTDLPIAEDVKQALLGRDNTLRDVYGLAVSYERAEWNQTSLYARRLHLNEKELPEIFLNSVNWASTNI